MTINGKSLRELLDEKQAARVLGCSVRTLQKKRWSGDGPPFVKLGRSVRYDPADLEEYVNRRRRRSTSDTGEHLDEFDALLTPYGRALRRRMHAVEKKAA